MANRFYTIMIVPEKTSQVRKIVVPSWLAKGSFIGALFLTVLAGIMLMDYWYVMSQIDENKQLKLDNRRLRQQVQIFKNKIVTIETTMDRLKTFATRLKVITNIEERGSLLQSLNQQKLPDAATNIGKFAKNTAAENVNPDLEAATSPAGAAPVDPLDPQEALLRKEVEELNQSFTELTHETLQTEQMLQDLYELLADQKSFLAALPTRQPAVGYFTSGFGVRNSPYGGRAKMHEGLDIANFPGTPIKAPADGTVAFAASKPGYGQTVILDHGYGLETWYGHGRKLLVKTGQKVKRGDTIAQLGNSGMSTGPHLHYEVRVNGIPVDPLTYILEK